MKWFIERSFTILFLIFAVNPLFDSPISFLSPSPLSVNVYGVSHRTTTSPIMVQALPFTGWIKGLIPYSLAHRLRNFNSLKALKSMSLSARIKSFEEEVADLKLAKDSLQIEIDHLKNQLSKSFAMVKSLSHEKSALKESYMKEIEQLEANYTSKINDITANLKEEYDKKLAQSLLDQEDILLQDKEDEIISITESHAKEIERLKVEISQLNQTNLNHLKTIEELKIEIKAKIQAEKELVCGFDDKEKGYIKVSSSFGLLPIDY
jgi:hypothetical protein